MWTGHNRQQGLLGLAGRKGQQRRRRWFCLCLCLFLAGLVCYSVVTIAQHMLAPARAPKGYIVLDPGHGGESSPGCAYGGIVERDVALDLSLLIRDELVQRGYSVMMTRDMDETVSLQRRTEMANESGADLLISIHLNAHDVTSVNGIETWFNPNTNNQSGALAEHIQQSIVAATRAKDRGICPDTSLYLTREVLLPSCLVEVGYLSNEEEREKMSTASYRRKIAAGIADGVERYFESLTGDPSAP